MTTAIKRRRGTTTQHATFTGLEGEITIDTTKDTVVVHDGATAGGFPLAKESQVTSAVAITGGTITGITDLAVADGGTGASTADNARTNLGVTATGADTTYAFRSNNLSDLASASTARTNLGLGTAATVADSSLVHIAGTETITGAKTFSTAPVVAGLSNSANLTFTGTGNRILGDFSNTTQANRLMFQNSITNGATSVGAMPNGTGANSAYNVFAGSDVANTSFGQFRVGTDTGDVRITSGIIGTGTYLPLTMYTGGSERLRIDTSGNVGIGTSSPLEKLHVAGGPVLVTGTLSALRANAVSLDFSGGTGRIIATGVDASTVAPIVFGNATTTSFAERMRINASGSVLIANTTAVDSEKLRVTQTSNNLAVFIDITAASSTSSPAISIRKQDNDNTTAQTYISFAFNAGSSGAGGIQGNGATGVQFFSSSDQRLKENIINLDSQLNNILSIKPRKFDFIEGPKDCIGLIAQEIETIYPDVVGETPDGYKTVGGISIMEVRLIKAIQELKAELDSVKAELQTLKGA